RPQAIRQARAQADRGPEGNAFPDRREEDRKGSGAEIHARGRPAESRLTTCPWTCVDVPESLLASSQGRPNCATIKGYWGRTWNDGCSSHFLGSQLCGRARDRRNRPHL